MPELPEVETSRRGIEPHIVGRAIESMVIRQRKLRWPISSNVDRGLPGQTVTSVGRRAKYLLINTTGGTAMIHLGMSGSLRICDSDDAPRKHDHVDIVLDNGVCLRFNDPRRFGLLMWWDEPAENHPLLRELGPEPLLNSFSGNHLCPRRP